MNLSRNLCIMVFALLVSSAVSDLETRYRHYLHQAAQPQQEMQQQQPPWYVVYPRHAAQSPQQEVQQPPAANPAFQTPHASVFEQGLLSSIHPPRQPWLDQQQHMAQSPQHQQQQRQQQKTQHQDQQVQNGRVQQEALHHQHQLPPFVASWEVTGPAPMYTQTTARSPSDRLATMMHKMDDLAREMQHFSPSIKTRLDELPDISTLESSFEHVIQTAREVMGARGAHVDPFMQSVSGMMDRVSAAIDDMEVMIQWPSRMPADVEEFARLHRRLQHATQGLKGIAQEMMRLMQANPALEQAVAGNVQMEPKAQMPEQQAEAVISQQFQEQQLKSQQEEGKNVSPQQEKPREEGPSLSQPEEGKSELGEPLAQPAR
eukprot:TRINITY_DN25553_c0_g1_i1.p1 TRINITY_DN25553_c0_g1~~TRINITY_DN25553_c0_g1_i1.p1  ORF type:complete len:374 (+),score=96.80 TRINITY_DN25553_c0_g1_i1:150-1271(+)